MSVMTTAWGTTSDDAQTYQLRNLQCGTLCRVVACESVHIAPGDLVAMRGDFVVVIFGEKQSKPIEFVHEGSVTCDVRVQLVKGATVTTYTEGE